MNRKDINIHDEKELIKFGNDYFEDCDKANRKLHRQWLLNILFLIGEQNCNVDTTTGMIHRHKPELDPEWMVQAINNRIIPIYRTMMSKMTKNRPIPMCTANSMEETDIQASRAAVKLAMNHWMNLELDRGHQDISAWLITCGNVFVKQFYNPKKGDIIDVSDDVELDIESIISEDTDIPEDYKSKIEETVLKVKDTGSITIGDTDLMVRSPFTCRPQRGKTDIGKMTIFGDSEFLTPDEVKDKYGIDVEPNKNRDKSHVLNVNINDIINGGELNMDGDSELIEVREIYILPDKTFPDGATYKWIGNDKMVMKPKGCNEIPFEHCGLIRVPGRFWCHDIITDLIPMQRRWNELLSKIEMHNDLYNDPPVIVDGDVIDIDEWTNRPGLLLERKSPGMGEKAVELVEVPMLDQTIFQEINLLDKQFEIVPVLNKVSFGKDTPNARSGLAINYLQEKDDDVIRPIISEIELFYTRVFKRDFKLCQENYTEDRGFAVVGKNNQSEWVDFKKAYLDANIDIQIEPGSAMPRSIAAQQSMVLELMDRGFFIDPKTQQMDYVRISRYLEFGAIDEMYVDATMDSDHAKRCIDKIKSGILVIVEEWFNPVVHLYEINRFRKTIEYEQLTEDIKFMIDSYAYQCLTMSQAGITPTMGPLDESSQSISSGPPNTTPPSGSPMQRGASPTSTADQPMTDQQIRAYLSRVRMLKPDLYNQIKDMDPGQVVSMLEPLVGIAKMISGQDIPQG